MLANAKSLLNSLSFSAVSWDLEETYTFTFPPAMKSSFFSESEIVEPLSYIATVFLSFFPIYATYAP